jgi:hypothetical protein
VSARAQRAVIAATHTTLATPAGNVSRLPVRAHTSQRGQATRAFSPVIHRQPKAGSGQAGGAQTITDADAVVRAGPPDFKPTGAKPLAVGTRVDVVDTQSAGKATYVQVVAHGTGAALGWTSASNLGDVQYAKAAASFVYVATVAPRTGRPNTLPVMVYTPPGFVGKSATDIVMYFHGDAADYSVGTANNYDRENPAIGMDLAGVAAGTDRIIVAPQVNVWPNVDKSMKSPWHTLQAGDYERIVQTVLTNLQDDLKLPAAIPRGAVSIAGHSGGGKALGQAAQDLDQAGGGVTDVTLVDAGYGGGENKAGEGDGPFARSFQMVRDWLLVGRREKVLRVITKARSPGTDTRHAIENNPDPAANEGGRIPVLGVAGVRRAITAKGLATTLQADATEVKDSVARTGGMQLIRTIVVSHKAGGKAQGTIYLFLQTDPPRAKGVDTHFGTRNATIGAIVSGRGKGDDFAVKP